MEDKANQALEQLLKLAISGVDSAVEFSQAQIPDVVEQLLMWKMIESLVPMAIAWIVATVFTYYFLKGLMKVKPVVSRDGDGMAPYIENEWFGRYQEPTARTFLTVIAPGAASLFSLLVALTLSNLDWLQILIAPKLYLLEYAAQLVR